MGKSKSFWTTPHKDGWAVKREGNSKASSVHDTQAEAWNETRNRAKDTGGEAYLQNKHGQIRERNTYGDDPYPPKG